MSDAHGRDHHHGRAGHGRQRQLPRHARGHHGQHGRVPSTFAPCVPTILYATLLAGQYATPAIWSREVRRSSPTPCRSTPIAARDVRGDLRGRARIVETRRRANRHGSAEIRRQNFTVPVRRRRSADLRHGRLCARASNDEDGRRRRLRGAQGRPRPKPASCAAWATAATSRGLRHGAVHRRCARRARRPVRSRRACVHRPAR